MPSFERLDQRFTDLVNVAGAECQRHIAAGEFAREPRDDVVLVGNKFHVQVAFALDRLIERVGGRPGTAR